MNTPEYKLLTDKYTAILAGLKSDPVAVAYQLKSSRILPQNVSEFMGIPYHSEADKARQLLKAVETQVEIDPQVIHIFYKALIKRSWCWQCWNKENGRFTGDRADN